MREWWVRGRKDGDYKNMRTIAIGHGDLDSWFRLQTLCSIPSVKWTIAPCHFTFIPFHSPPFPRARDSVYRQLTPKATQPFNLEQDNMKKLEPRVSDALVVAWGPRVTCSNANTILQIKVN
ncbi:hypothetical protein VNO78_00681 [Psophocarpus tetragonolobus]|uniref:Uncharacterized protein n=1 Tax=Psophocarpus tetragonolobus TaxID=3891 RepID=A0AAN9SZQ0_PSOTE